MRAVSGFAFLLLSCGVHAAEYNVGSLRVTLIDDPVQVRYQERESRDLDNLRRAVEVAAASKGWKFTGEAAGRYQLVRDGQKHFVRIELLYDAAGYRVRYLESANLLYRTHQRSGADVRVIHGIYNVWIRELVAAINASAGLSAKPFIGTLPIDDASAIPLLKDDGRVAYKAFLGSPMPRAFALSPSGNFGWSTFTAQVPYRDGLDVVEEAMESCRKAGDSCRLFAIDDRVVWSEP